MFRKQLASALTSKNVCRIPWRPWTPLAVERDPWQTRSTVHCPTLPLESCPFKGCIAFKWLRAVFDELNYLQLIAVLCSVLWLKTMAKTTYKKQSEWKHFFLWSCSTKKSRFCFLCYIYLFIQIIMKNELREKSWSDWTQRLNQKWEEMFGSCIQLIQRKYISKSDATQVVFINELSVFIKK